MTTEEKTTYSYSGLIDKFTGFFNEFKDNNGNYKYVDTINGLISHQSIIQIDYNDFTDEIKNIFENTNENKLHRVIYDSIVDMVKTENDSMVESLKTDNKIKFEILNYEKFSGKIFDNYNKSYTESAITDAFVKFFNSFKINGEYRYVDSIDALIVSDHVLEIDYNDLTEEIKSIFEKYEDKIHSTLYRAIKNVLRVRIGSSVSGLEDENKIKFEILNYKKFHGRIFEKPKSNDVKSSFTEPDDEEKIPATVKVFNIGHSLIQKEIKSENDTEQIAIQIHLKEKPHWIDIFSPTFEQMIRVELQKIHSEIYADSTYRTGIKNLHANALLNGTVTKKVFSRCALVNNNLFYDLQNDDGVVYKISNDEIKQVEYDDDVPIFLKSPSTKTTKSMQVEPKFENSGALNEFVKLCRIQELDKIVFIPHLISFFLNGFPIPIKVLHGEQGSAKTSVAGAIKSLIDPEGENAQSLPEKIDDLAVLLSKHELSNFDNTDNFTKEISQFLCRAVTGTQYGKRGLYTNDTEFSLTLRSKIILNGIDPSINQPDLLERSIFYELPKIAKSERITDKKFHDRIEELRPYVLGEIFLIIQKSMSIIDEVEKELEGVSLPRMSSFAVWGEAISRVLGNNNNKFINRYWAKLDDSNLDLNEEYPMIPLIVDMMKRNCILNEDKQPVQMQKMMSLKEMFDDLIGNDNKDYGLPQDMKLLGKQLKQLTPILRTMGYEMEVVRYDKRDDKFPRGTKVIKITPIDEKGLDGFQ